MELIKQLKEEHVKILQGFESIKKGVAKGESGDIDLINELRDLKYTLVVHLDLEDERLYPGLINAGGEAKELGKKFSGEMLELSKTAIVFFGKYMSETIGDLLKSSVFRKELNAVIQAIAKRIDTEEKILFPAFEKYCDKT